MFGTFAIPQAPPVERQEPPPILPLIKVKQNGRSLYDIPEIDIAFPDGHLDQIVLEKHFFNQEDRMANKEHCNYFGHLKNDPNACIAVTGCYGRDDLEFTILAGHGMANHMFVMQKDGQLRIVERTINVSFHFAVHQMQHFIEESFHVFLFRATMILCQFLSQNQGVGLPHWVKVFQ